MLSTLLGVAATVVGAFFALLGWSLTRVSHVSDDRMRSMFDEYMSSRGTSQDR